MPAVIGIVLLLIAIIVGGLIFSRMHEETWKAVERTGTVHTYVTKNPTFDTDVSGWENVVVQDAAVNAYDATGKYVTISTTENDATVDIGEWKQKLNVKLYDYVDPSYEKYAYAVLDVTGIGTGSVVVKLILEKPDATRIILHELKTTTTVAWTAVEKDVKPYVDTSGDYYIVMRAELLATSTTPSLKVGFDNAELKVAAYEYSAGERMAKGIGETGQVIFSILSILALVGVIFAVVWAFTRR